uniref:MMS19 nucleotide excision repair protein n=1 Tax=Babesia bovis TaxID=5865 RepID=A7AWT5_BABBO|eukprot:XP_001609081.1 hypothetical protein [Babesia bovis T2Bo]
MDISRLVELQQRLNAALMLWSGAGSHLEKTQRMQDLLDQSLALISGLHGSSHINRDILNWISRNVLSVVNVVLNHMCSLSRADIDGQLYVQKGHILVKMLLIVLQHPSEDQCLRTKVLLCGVLTSWRILFSNSDTNMCSSLASFRRSSLVVGDILELCTGIFSSLERDEHSITMCMILLEILSFSDTPRHRSAVLDCLAHVPPDPVVARIYPGLVSRVVSILSELRESDFGRAMNVLKSWIPKALACDCSGEACWRRSDANMAKNAHKTSEAIVMVFKKYARVFPSHMTDLSIACLRCACLSQEVIHCIQNHVIFILDTDKLLGEARCIAAASSIAFKLSLRSEVTSQLSSCQDPQRTLAIYLGYADLEKHVSGLSQIDPYVVMEMLYRCAEVPPAADGTAFVALPRLSRCETSVDLADFCEPHEQVFLKAAGDHIGRMPPAQQKQVISDLLDHFIVGVGDRSRVLRLLAVLRGLLNCGSTCISAVIPEIVEVIMLKVVHSDLHKESHVAALALFATVFRRYQVTLPAQQMCDILFWSLPWCMSDCERGYNYARALVYRIAMRHWW